MTSILGLRHGGASYLAADSLSCAGNPIPARATKLRRSSRWMVASSGLIRLTNLLQEIAFDDANDIAALVRLLKAAVEADGWVKETGAGSPTYGEFCLLVASPETIWHVGADFSFLPLDENRPWGQGSGAKYAEAACTALLACGREPEQAMREAIRIASTYDPGTDDRVTVEVLRSPMIATLERIAESSPERFITAAP